MLTGASECDTCTLVLWYDRSGFTSSQEVGFHMLFFFFSLHYTVQFEASLQRVLDASRAGSRVKTHRGQSMSGGNGVTDPEGHSPWIARKRWQGT